MPTNDAPPLQIQNVTYRIDDVTILDNVSWQVGRREHWAMLGPNGAGKTTLLKLACGYIWPNGGGEVRRLGERLSDLRELRRSMGWVSHRLAADIPRGEPALDTVVSGCVAQVGLKSGLQGPQPTRADYDTAAAHLADLDAERLAKRSFGVLSQGEQQKVLIARALMARPLLIFLDEPCAGLDPGAREHFLADIEKLASGGSAPSMIMVTHHIEEIMPPFENIVVMQNARIVRTGRTQEVIDAQLVEDLYGTPPRELLSSGGRIWPVF